MIEIKSRWNSEVMVYTSESDNLKEAVTEAVKNGANLYGADLRSADLYGADLRGVNLRVADLYGANLYGANLRVADLCGADLRVADLHGANLYGANLYGANLYGADLYGAENYSEIHQIFLELIKRERIKTFNNSEWEIIGQISIHLPCWDTIVSRFAAIPMTNIFRILADKGFDEYLVKYKKEQIK